MLDQAIEYAQTIPYVQGQERFCAIITNKRGQTLTVGYNSYTESCKLQRFYAKVAGLPEKAMNHSEIDALRQLKDHMKPYYIYVARVNRKGEPLLAKPCVVCQNAILNFGLRVVKYTETD